MIASLGYQRAVWRTGSADRGQGTASAVVGDALQSGRAGPGWRGSQPDIADSGSGAASSGRDQLSQLQNHAP